jgi:hypothetical protein
VNHRVEAVLSHQGFKLRLSGWIAEIEPNNFAVNSSSKTGGKIIYNNAFVARSYGCPNNMATDVASASSD